MNESQLELHQRIQAFALGDDTHAVSFSQHLARSNRWSVEFAELAVDEYKKFAFLAVVAGHPVSPSDQVDQVWHLHILYSHSYWDDFCAHILRYPFHHHPARGGREDRETLHHWYRMTLDSYYRFFGEPPAEIWPTPCRRFGKDLHMQRINTTEFWIVPKLPEIKVPRLTKGIGVLLLFLAIVGCSNVAQVKSLEHKNWLKYYSILYGMVPLGAYLFRWLQRTSGAEPVKPQLDHYEIAYLVGGKERAVDLAITNLVEQQYLQPNPSDRSFSILKMLPDTSYCLELDVMSQVQQNGKLSKIRHKVAPRTTFLHDRLRKYGLLMKGSEVIACYFISILIVVGAVILAYFLTVSDAERVLECIGIMGFMLLNGLTSVFSSDRSQYGDRFLAQLKPSHSTSIAYNFALSGPSTLSGGALDDLKQVFDPSSTNADGGCGGCGC